MQNKFLKLNYSCAPARPQGSRGTAGAGRGAEGEALYINLIMNELYAARKGGGGVSKLQRFGNFAIPDHQKVKVTEMGNVIELLYTSFANTQVRIRKLDKDHYILVDPDGNEIGDVKEFQHFESRADSVSDLRQTFRKLRAIINANVVDIDLVRFVTLTYAQPDGEPMTDPERLYHDFERFFKRLRRWLEKEGYDRPEYINVVEPQGSGSWHCHVLMFWNEKAPYLPNDKVREMWGQGFVTIKSLRNHLGKACDNVGAYLTAYLGDLDIESALTERMDITKFQVKEGEKGKKFLKGARLWLYPPGMSIYRCSRGVKRPIETKCSYEEAKRKVSAATLTFQSNLRVDLGDKSNTISKRYYNTAVKSSQVVADGFRIDSDTGEVLEVLDSKLVPDETKPDTETKTQAWIRRNLRELTFEEQFECPWPLPDPEPERSQSVDLLPFASYNQKHWKRADKSYEWTEGPKEGARLALIRHIIKSTK